MPPAAAVEAALERILASEAFAGSPRLQRFLRHIVETTLAGRARELRAYAIAFDVFDRGSDFDPQTDSLVRVEAGRLRQKLTVYAAGDGRDDSVRITLPKGGYVPIFEVVARGEPPSDGAAGRALGRSLRRRRPGRMAGAMLLVAVALAGGFFWLSAANGELASVEAALPARPARTLGVLPFAVLDSDPLTRPATAAVAGGLTALVTADLVRFRQHFVLAERSAAAIAAGDGDPIRAAEIAGLDFVVDGTVRRAPGGIVVTTSLINTVDGQAVWSETYTEPSSDRAALDLEDEIAGAIVTALAQP